MKPVDVVRRYLHIFETEDVGDLANVVAEDVEIWGAGTHVRGRHHIASVHTPGLSNCRMNILELVEAGDRVIVYFQNTYHHDSSDRDVLQSGIKMYEVRAGKIVRFWGETDLFGLLRQLGKVPAEISFT